MTLSPDCLERVLLDAVPEFLESCCSGGRSTFGLRLAFLGFDKAVNDDPE